MGSPELPKVGVTVQPDSDSSGGGSGAPRLFSGQRGRPTDIHHRSRKVSTLGRVEHLLLSPTELNNDRSEREGKGIVDRS